MSKNVVVTGAGRGFGSAITQTLVARGWNVWATDADAQGLSASKAQNTAVLDVTDPASVQAVFARVEQAGGVDALVNNAGIYPLRAWDEHDADLMHRVFGVNVVGPLQCAQAAARSMIDRGVPGAIVNIVSLAFHKGHDTGLAYAASKGGLIGLTRSLAKALGPHRIRVNALSPGFMLTEGTEQVLSSGAYNARDRVTGSDPARALPGVNTTGAVAPMVAVLLDDDAAEMTGQVLVADGGTYFL